jgi:hypothetical protein
MLFLPFKETEDSLHFSKNHIPTQLISAYKMKPYLKPSLILLLLLLLPKLQIKKIVIVLPYGKSLFKVLASCLATDTCAVTYLTTAAWNLHIEYSPLLAKVHSVPSKFSAIC